MRPTHSVQADTTASKGWVAEGSLQSIPSTALACFVLLSRMYEQPLTLEMSKAETLAIRARFRR